MIVKYYNEGAWGYIDNVRQAACKEIDPQVILKEHDAEVAEGKRADICATEDYPREINDINKIFLMATAEIGTRTGNVHHENLLEYEKIKDGYAAQVILLYIEDCKEYDAVILVTNQNTFLMNDKGQTIERLA